MKSFEVLVMDNFAEIQVEGQTKLVYTTNSSEMLILAEHFLAGTFPTFLLGSS